MVEDAEKNEGQLEPPDTHPGLVRVVDRSGNFSWFRVSRRDMGVAERSFYPCASAVNVCVFLYPLSKREFKSPESL